MIFTKRQIIVINLIVRLVFKSSTVSLDEQHDVIYHVTTLAIPALMMRRLHMGHGSAAIACPFSKPAKYKVEQIISLRLAEIIAFISA